MRCRDLFNLVALLTAVGGAGLSCKGAPDPCDEADATVVLDEESNYAFEGSLEIRSAALAAGSDPLFDWSALSTDLQGHDLDPVADIDAVAVVAFWDLDHQQVQDGLSTNSLAQKEMAIFVSAQPGDATSIYLSDLNLLGNDIDVEQYFEEGYAESWLLLVSTGIVPGVGTRMALFIEPDDDATATSVTMTNTDTVLDFSADLTSLTPVPVPADAPDLTLVWDDLETDGQGADFQPSSIDELMVGYYPDLDATDLEEQFLDIERIAETIWTLEVTSVTDLVLAAATSDPGGFPGVSTRGTWVLALRCGGCANPAPPALTVLKGCE
jgi:hypothetical protein